MTAETIKTESERLCQRFLARVLDERDTLTVREILREEMPDMFAAVAHYRAKKLFDADSPVLLTPHKRYSYKNNEVQENLEALRGVIIQETVFFRKEVAEICEWAFRFQVEALIQPRSKLLELLFKKDRTGKIPAGDVLVVLGGFDTRRRLIGEMRTAIANSGARSFDRESLARMSFATGTALFRETPISTILSEAAAYLRFESSVAGAQKSALSFSVLLAILDEWGLEVIASALKEEYDEKKTWTPAEIEGAFGRHLVLGGDISSRRKRPTSKPRLDAVQLRRKAQTRRRTEFEALQFNFLDDPELETPTQPEGEKKAGSFSQAQLDSEEPNPELQMPDKTVARSASREKDEEKEILRGVFANNESDYKSFMQRVAATKTWKQAQGEIERELSSRRIGPFARESAMLSAFVFLKCFSDR